MDLKKNTVYDVEIKITDMPISWSAQQLCTQNLAALGIQATGCTTSAFLSSSPQVAAKRPLCVLHHCSLQ
jgi:hypothetical protein